MSSGARSDLGSARILTIVAMILLALLAVLLIGFTVSALLFPFTPQTGGALILAVPLLATGYGVIPLILLVLTYAYVYRRLTETRVAEATSPSLALGILGVLFGGLIPGILLLVAHGKANDAQRKLASV